MAVMLMTILIKNQPCNGWVAGADANNTSVRSYLVDLNKELDTLTSTQTRLTYVINLLSQVNGTTDILAIRRKQSQKIQSAIDQITIERNALNSKCSRTQGDNCNEGCWAGYTGSDCSQMACFGVLPTNASVCSGRGKCIGPDVCNCSYPFIGNNCQSNNMTYLTFTASGYKYTDGKYARSCNEYRYPSMPYIYNNEGSGLYQINPSNVVFTVYCDMDTMGGGWTLIMKTSSTQSKYGYYSTVWTNSNNANFSSQIDLNIDQDFVSPAFYNLTGSESMLAMGKLINYNSWYHNNDTAKNLVNSPLMSSGAYVKGICNSQTNCGTQPVNSLPSGVFQVITSGTYSFGSWNRFGYVNCNNPGNFGSSIRIGFSGDMNDSDSSDTIMGIGLDCILSCQQYSTTIAGTKHNSGSGFYLYKTSASVTTYDKSERAWLWIR